MISYLFNEIFYRPLFNGLIFLYNIIPIHDIGISIIVLTIVIRLILWPLTTKSIKNQKTLTQIQPKIEEIRRKFKSNREVQAKALMELYSEHKINPLAGFLPILIQIPIIIALWRVFLSSINFNASFLYSFIKAPDSIQAVFLGLIDLSQKSVVLVIAAGILQYFQAKMIMPPAKATEGKPAGNPDFSRVMSKQMLYLAPVLSVVIFWSLPAALSLYWVVFNILLILQQYFTRYDNGELKKN
jgi:YidC/Oxa1 family membrane protein insertase